MKRYLILFSLLAAVSIARAEDISLPSGEVLRNASVSQFFAGEFVIEHAGGIAHVPWAQMPAEWQAKFHRDAQVEAREKRIVVLKAAVANQVRLGVRTIKEVASDVASFDGREVSFEGTIEISDYYNYGFKDAAGSYFSFEVNDGTGRMHVYFLKGKAEALRTELLQAGKPLQGIVRVSVSNAATGPMDLLARGLAFYPPSLKSSDALVSRTIVR